MTEIDTTINLVLLQQNDKAEFNRFVEMYSERIYRLIFRILGDEKDAEDILQEVFIKVFKNIKAFEGRSSLTTWLYRIATNESLLHLRKRSPLTVQGLDEYEDDGETIEKPVLLVDWSSYPEDIFSSKESKKFINKAIQSLSLPLRLVFQMRDIEGLSIKETEDALNISESAVKLRLLRARLKLREKLSEFFAGAYPKTVKA
jgi:RNA polymerase sigma-70 factor (ECF subfamily)